jgi:hypothetical protein
MPEPTTVKRAKADLAQGKSPSTAAGEFVREELEHVREGKHGARSPQQAIAIGLSKARRAGVPLDPPARGRASGRTRRAAARDLEVGQGARQPRAPSAKRSRAVKKAVGRMPKEAASPRALSAQGKRAAAERTPSERRAAAKRGATTRKRTATRRTDPKRTAPKRTAPKRTATKRTAAKRTSAKRTGARRTRS